MNLRSILLAGLALAGLTLSTTAQVRGLNQGAAGNPSQIAPGGNDVPTNSPEPITLIALGSGAAIAGGAAYRRRKNRRA